MQSSFWLITSISTTQIYALPTGDCCSNSTEERGERESTGCIFRWKDFFLACFWTVALKCSGHCACVTRVCNSFCDKLKSFILLLYSHAVSACYYQSISVHWLKWTFFFFLFLVLCEKKKKTCLSPLKILLTSSQMT